MTILTGVWRIAQGWAWVKDETPIRMEKMGITDIFHNLLKG